MSVVLALWSRLFGVCFCEGMTTRIKGKYHRDNGEETVKMLISMFWTITVMLCNVACIEWLLFGCACFFVCDGAVEHARGKRKPNYVNSTE